MIKKPEKIYPCDCMGEGLVVHEFDAMDEWENPATLIVLEDDYYAVNISFWGVGPYDDGKLFWWKRIRAAWYILKKGHPWHDMVSLRLSVARSFANRVLYLANKAEQEKENGGVKEPVDPRDKSKMTDKTNQGSNP